MKVGMLTTWETRCGIAAYTSDLVTCLRALPNLEVEVVPIAEGIQSQEHYERQAEILNRCDVVHIQHEYSFWGGFTPGKNRFHTLRRLIERPVVLTAHTTTAVSQVFVYPAIPKSGPLGPRIRAAYRVARKRIALTLLFNSVIYPRWIEVSPFASADQVIVHTGQARETLARRGIRDEKIHVLPAGIPCRIAGHYDGNTTKKKYGLQNSRVVTLFGYITPYKGYELVLRTLPGLPPDVHFLIAGGSRTDFEDDYVQQLIRQVEESGLSNRVTITGYLSDSELAGVMAATDVVVVPHTIATGSYSIAIPLAYGKPIVASDLACFRDIHDRLPSLILFQSGNEAELTSALGRLLDDGAQRACMSLEAADYAAKNSWAEVAKRTRKVYELAVKPSTRVV